MRKIFCCSVFLLMAVRLLSAQSVPEKWLTDCEKSGFKQTPRYAETMAYCRKIEKASPWVKVTSFGMSPEGRSLPLVIVSNEKAFTPAKAAATNKAVILIQNGIHAGEIEGKDASLMLLRDIAILKSKASLLDHAILLIIPIYNVDGHERFGPYNRINQNGPEEMGWRVTAQNLNLNRDYVKADAPETQAWLKLYTAWLPDFFIDCHVTDGADYQYVVTYGIETHENVPAPVREWVNTTFLPSMKDMKINDVPIGPLINFRSDLEPLKGLLAFAGTAPPRFSTVYTPLQNRPGLLIEMHMLKDYKTRVEANYQFLDALIRRINEQSASLRQAVRRADEETAGGVENPFPLVLQADTVPSSTLRYFGFQQTNTASEISGGKKRVYSKDPYEAMVPVYEKLHVSKSVIPPYAYIIPRQWQEVISRLKLHGIKLERLKQAAELNVESYRFSNPKWQSAPFEGRLGVSYDVQKVEEKRAFPAGSIVVRLHQRAARVAIHALEPESPDAFVAWGFFNAIFEQKEYGEDYVLEKLASGMLAKDTLLAKHYVERVQSDSIFAKNYYSRLNFFYQHSPYWDVQMDLYPVARLMEETPLITEPIK